MADVSCSHLDRIEVEPPARDNVEGCEECLKTGSSWSI